MSEVFIDVANSDGAFIDSYNKICKTKNGIE